jgi:hypothetical protein
MSLQRDKYFIRYARWKNQSRTSIVCVKTPFSIAKCRLASPSVTKDILAWPPGLSGTKPAFTAAFRIWLCSFPSHPFGCDSTKWTSSLAPDQTLCPLGCASRMYASEQSSRYRRKSAKTSTTVFLGGRGGTLGCRVFPSPYLDLR